MGFEAVQGSRLRRRGPDGSRLHEPPRPQNARPSVCRFRRPGRIGAGTPPRCRPGASNIVATANLLRLELAGVRHVAPALASMRARPRPAWAWGAGAAAPRPPSAAPAVQHPLPPTSAPAAPATRPGGRTSDTAVVPSQGRDPARPPAIPAGILPGQLPMPRFGTPQVPGVFYNAKSFKGVSASTVIFDGDKRGGNVRDRGRRAEDPAAQWRDPQGPPRRHIR